MKEDNTVYKVADEYSRLISSKLEKLELDLADASKHRLMYEALIIINSNNIYSNNALIYINDIRSNKGIYIINKLRKAFNINSTINVDLQLDTYLNSIVTGSIQNDEAKIIKMYYKLFYKNAVKEILLNERICKYKRYSFDKNLIMYLFREYFKYVGHELLRFNNHEFYTLPKDVMIAVKGKSKIKHGEKYGYKRKVDWGSSFRTLKVIANNNYPDILKRYTDNIIKKNEFIKEMSKYTYNEKTNPNGKKWLVYSNLDSNFWLVIRSRFSNLSGIRNYNIVPTNFIENKTRSQIDFTNEVKSVEEIITSNLLGFRDKIRAIERYDYSYLLNNLRNDI